jgi:hypothetical protein
MGKSAHTSDDPKVEQGAAGPSQLAAEWLARREKVVTRALEDGDHDKLREVAALPGGFGSNAMRQKVWYVSWRSCKRRLLRPGRYYYTRNDTSGTIMRTELGRASNRRRRQMIRRTKTGPKTLMMPTNLLRSKSNPRPGHIRPTQTRVKSCWTPNDHSYRTQKV